MRQGLKRRLIGAIVLIIALVASAPALFRGGSSHPLVVATMLPPNPSPPIPVILEKLDTPADAVSTEVTATKPIVDADGKPGLDQEGRLKAWSLQLATFTQQSNAETLEAKLLSKGYAAYTRRQERDRKSPLFRVYVGPEVRPDELNVAKKDLERELRLAGIIVRYQP